MPSHHGSCSYDVVLLLYFPVQLGIFRFIRCSDLVHKFQRSSMSTLEARHLSPHGEASGVSSKKTDYQLVVTLVGMKICCDPVQSRNVDIYRLYFYLIQDSISPRTRCSCHLFHFLLTTTRSLLFPGETLVRSCKRQT